MSVAKPFKQHTIEEFEQMVKDDHHIYELIDGVIMMSPRPAKKHQNISGNLYFELRNALKYTDCKPIQEIDLALNNDILVPDLMVLCNDTMDGTRQTTPPLIVMEIVSPSSASHDYMLKRLKYRQMGIQEYWIISPDDKCIWVIHYAQDAEHHYCEGQAKSEVLPELTVDLEQIFV